MIEIRVLRTAIYTSLIAVFVVFCLSLTVSAQKRDNLTEKEDMQIREAQELDLRMKVFVKVVDRRFSAIAGTDTSRDKQFQKDLEIWGELRTGTKQELFWDIQKTIDEAILKLDDAAERDVKNPLFGPAVHVLADACRKWIPQFKSALSGTADEKEKGLILGSSEYCDQIIEAAVKVPKAEKKKKN